MGTRLGIPRSSLAVSIESIPHSTGLQRPFHDLFYYWLLSPQITTHAESAERRVDLKTAAPDSNNQRHQALLSGVPSVFSWSRALVFRSSTGPRRTTNRTLPQKKFDSPEPAVASGPQGTTAPGVWSCLCLVPAWTLHPTQTWPMSRNSTRLTCLRKPAWSPAKELLEPSAMQWKEEAQRMQMSRGNFHFHSFQGSRSF